MPQRNYSKKQEVMNNREKRTRKNLPVRGKSDCYRKSLIFGEMIAFFKQY